MSERSLHKARTAIERIASTSSGERREQAVFNAFAAVHEVLIAQHREIEALRNKLEVSSGPGSTGRSGG